MIVWGPRVVGLNGRVQQTTDRTPITCEKVEAATFAIYSMHDAAAILMRSALQPDIEQKTASGAFGNAQTAGLRRRGLRTGAS